MSPVVVGDPGVRPTWDQYGLALALTSSMRGDCTRRKVGAIMLGTDHRTLGTGYNGYPSGQPGCLSSGACPRGRLTYEQMPTGTPYVGVAAGCGALHAEESLILDVPRKERAGATLYVSDEPCPNCQRILTGAGLARTVWPDGEIVYP